MKNSKIKPPVLLKIIIDILLILLILATIFSMIFFNILLWIPEDSIPFPIHPDLIDSFNEQAFTILGFEFLSWIIFIYTIFKLKKLVNLFFKGEFLSKEQIKITNIIGKLIIIVAILEKIPSFIYKNFLEESPRTISYGISSFGSFWFVLALGLFFIFLSRILDNARILKEENELTV